MSSSAGSRTAAAAAAAAATAAAAVAAAAQAALAALPEPRIYDYSDEDTDLVLQGACWKVDMGALDADAAEYMLLTEEELAAYEKFSGMKFSAMDAHAGRRWRPLRAFGLSFTPRPLRASAASPRCAFSTRWTGRP